jgi:SOS-response transcriptional repressor LexA
MAKEKRLPLTPRQREAYDFVRPFEKEKGYGPSIQEVAQFLGVSWGSAGKVLDALIEKQYLTRTKGVNRSLRVA